MTDKLDLKNLTKAQLIEAIHILEEYENRHKYNKLGYLYPDKGPLSRDKYPKHMKFFKAGTEFKERAALGGNRSGKTYLVHTELAYHLTGKYPEWWEGRRFQKPIKAWCICATNDLVRDVSQELLLGKKHDLGSGFLPRGSIVETRAKPGIPNAISEAVIQWGDKKGEYSTVGFKSYEQGREAFQGVALDVVVFDEEPNMDVYTEALTRTMTTEGIVMSSFTPLSGLSDLVLSFLPDGQFPSNNHVPGTYKYVESLSWEEAPHLSEEAKKTLLSAYLPHELEARTKGRPSVGRGKVYTAMEDDFVIDPFKIPGNWPKMYAMDVGWKITAAVWLALDPNTDTVYVIDEYYGSQQVPEVHAAAIKRRGKWLYGAIDPAAMKGSERDGKKLVDEYRKLELNLILADNAVEAGITRVVNRLSVGKLKVFSTCSNFLQEYRIYARDKDGRIIKKRDHLMDCLRYGISRLGIAKLPPDEDDDLLDKARRYHRDQSRDKITGY